MGALTDNRKRCLVEHHLTSESPPSKKPKIFSSLRLPEPAVMNRMSRRQDNPPPPSVPVLRRFPPPAPLSRPVHGPQRIIKAFGLGSSNSIKSPPQFSTLGTEKGEMSAGTGSLGLEEYKRLVVDVQEARPAVATSIAASEAVILPSAFDLPVMTWEDEKPSDLYILDRKVLDDGKVVVESTPVREERLRVKTSPLYKELYEASSRKYNPWLNKLQFEAKLFEKKASFFRLVREVLAKKPKEDLHGPFAPLTDEEEQDVNHALRGGSYFEVLVIHESSNIEITREVLQCLSRGAWLNDEVINLYLELLKERERREPKRFLKCHFFNTFFYKKLISGKNGYDFKAVRRWTSQKKLGYCLIECDKIFVPIHKEVHWCLAIINVKDKKFQYLDSLGGMDRTVLRILERYFLEEVKEKSDQQIDVHSWKQEAVDDLPLQENGWDCGMFMLKYTDFYSRDLNLNFGQEHMEYFRKRTIKEILRLRAE